MIKIESEIRHSVREYGPYENSSYGIKIQHPLEWEGKELNQTYQNITDIVEFGLSLGHKSSAFRLTTPAV